MILGADVLLDGGTVHVSTLGWQGFARYELDYSLPLDGRPRYISVRKFGRTKRIPIGSDEEKEICASIQRNLERRFGRRTVISALESSEARREAFEKWCSSQEESFVNLSNYEDPYPLPFDGYWAIVFYFVEKAHREGKLSLSS